MQAYDLIMYGYFRIGFIDFMLEKRNLWKYTNIFLSNKYDENDKIILRYF